MSTHPVRLAALLTMFLAVPAPARAQGWQHLGDVERVERLADGVEVASGASRVRVTAFAPGVIRVRMLPPGTPPEPASWAVVARPAPPPLRVEDTARGVRLAAGALAVDIGKSPLRLRFTDAAGNVVLDDAAVPTMAVDGGGRVRAWMRLPADEHYYGLGDKAGPLDRRGRAFVNWNTDAYAWQAQTDPLYKSIPFFIGLRKGRAYGVFLDNTWRSEFDFGKDDPDTLSFGADGGALDYYVVAGPAPADVLGRYTALTGRTPLPPRWALGFQQSRYTYVPEARVREVADTLRAHRIPADALWLDIGFQDGNRPFTVDRQAFPSFERMLAALRAQGLRTVLITDLHLKREPGYAPYDSGLRADAFLHNPDGSTYVGRVWPGDSVFPDFTLSRVRDWWGGLYRAFVAMGAAGFWNDMNEPSVFDGPGGTMPPDVMHRLDDGTRRAHRALHNVYGMQNARATYEGVLRLRPAERPFVLTRAAYAGTQRYAATWTGDNTASWHHLAQSTPNLLGLGLSGLALAGDDIGGFIGSPPPDLLTRWYQLGAFNPVFRSHAATDTRAHEPWADGPAEESARRAAIELRYRLLPYLYTAAEENARTGLPIMRPVFLAFPAAEAFYGNDRDFLFGPDLFVAPVVSERRDPHQVVLPPGGWYDFRTGSAHAGGEHIVFDPAPAEVPVYARAGAIVPMQPLVQHTGEVPQGPLQLHVYLPERGGDCHGSLYDDDGLGFAYRRGAFLRIGYACTVAADGVAIRAGTAHRGHAPWWRTIALEIHGVAARPREVLIGARAGGDWRYDAATRTLAVTVPAAAGDWEVALRE